MEEEWGVFLEKSLKIVTQNDSKTVSFPFKKECQHGVWQLSFLKNLQATTKWLIVKKNNIYREYMN